MLKLKRFDEGVWTEFPNSPGVQLKIKPITPTDMLECRYKAKRKVAVVNPDGESRRAFTEILKKVTESKILSQDEYFLLDAKVSQEIVDDYDGRIADWEFFKLALQDTEGIGAIDKENPTKDEIIRACYRTRVISDFVSEKALALYREEEIKLGQELKNSESSQSGLKNNEN